MGPLIPLAAGMMGVQALSGLYNANQQRVAAADQLRAAGRAQGAITDAYGQAQGYQQPYIAAGQAGLNAMYDPATGNLRDYGWAVPGQAQMPGEYQAQQFQFDPNQDPGAAYRMQQGQQAVQTGAAAQGTGLSGSTLKQLQKMGQEMGSQEYGAAYNRFNQDRQAGLQGYQQNMNRANDIWGQQKDLYTMGNQQQMQRYGQAQNLGNYGQTAAQNMSNLASDYGSNLAGLYGTQGQIKAGGRVAAANSINQGIGGAANTGMDALTLQGLMGGGGSKPRYNSGERML